MEDKHQAHGLTVKEIKEIGEKQVLGEVKKIPANNATSIKDEHFKKEYEGYEIYEHDAHLYHVAQESRLFDQATGQKKSHSSVGIYSEQVFKVQQDKVTGVLKSMFTHILHDPTLEKKKTSEDVNKEVKPPEATKKSPAQENVSK